METVTFLQAGTREDPYSGETVRDNWDAPEPVLTRTMLVEPIASQEPAQDGRQAVIIGYRLYLQGEKIAVDPSWRAQVRGDILRVDGKAAEWAWGFTDGAAGTVVQVGLTSG